MQKIVSLLCSALAVTTSHALAANRTVYVTGPDTVPFVNLQSATKLADGNRSAEIRFYWHPALQRAGFTVRYSKSRWIVRCEAKTYKTVETEFYAPDGARIRLALQADPKAPMQRPPVNSVNEGVIDGICGELQPLAENIPVDQLDAWARRELLK